MDLTQQENIKHIKDIFSVTNNGGRLKPAFHVIQTFCGSGKTTAVCNILREMQGNWPVKSTRTQHTAPNHSTLITKYYRVLILVKTRDEARNIPKNIPDSFYMEGRSSDEKSTFFCRLKLKPVMGKYTLDILGRVLI